MNICKLLGLSVVLSILMVLICTPLQQDCTAGGGANWKVKVINPIPYKVRVSVYTRKNVGKSLVIKGTVEEKCFATANIA